MQGAGTQMVHLMSITARHCRVALVMLALCCPLTAQFRGGGSCLRSREVLFTKNDEVRTGGIIHRSTLGDVAEWTLSSQHEYVLAKMLDTSRAVTIATSEVPTLSGIPQADQFPGADMCAKLAAAIASYHGKDGLIDARSFRGNQTCRSNPFAGVDSAQSLRIEFGPVSITTTAGWVIPAGTNRMFILRGANPPRGAGAATTASGTVINNTSRSSDTITIVGGSSGVMIEGFFFRGSSTGKHINVSSQESTSSQITIRDNQFHRMSYGVYATTIGLGSLFELNVLSNIFDEQTATGIYLHSANDGSISQIRIEGNRVQNFGENGIDTYRSSGNVINYNQITNGNGASSVGLKITTGGATSISNNDFESMHGVSAKAMSIAGGAFTIFNNNFYDNNQDLLCACTRSLIAPNNFNKGTHATDYAIKLAATSTGVIVLPQSNDSYPSGVLSDDAGNSSNMYFDDTGIVSTYMANLRESTTPSGAGGASRLWADATGHRLHMNNNNAGAKTVAATDGDTFTNTILAAPVITGDMTYVSTTRVANLNADQVDGYHAAALPVGRSTTIGSAPACSVTGAGADALCMIDPGGSDSAGTAYIAAMGTGPMAAGTITITFTSSLGANYASCQVLPMSTKARWNARASIQQLSLAKTNSVQTWDNDAIALSSGNKYAFSYRCVGQ